MVSFPRRPGVAILIAAAAVLVTAGTARAGSFITTVQTTAANASDSYVTQDHVDERNGDKSELRLKASSGGKNRRIVLATSLPSLTNRTVLQAWLGLTEFGASNATPIESRVYALLEPFDEERVSWKERLDKVAWSTPGGTRDARWSGRAPVSTATNGERVDWQVGPIVNEWLLGALPQYGFILEPDPTGNDREVVFRSSEYTSVPAATPRLTLYVTDEPPAIRRGIAEFQPTSVRASTPNSAFTLWLDVEASGSTPSGAATGFDLITIQHAGSIAGRSVDRVTVAGVDLPLAQVTWFENGTSMTIRVPRITVVGKVRVDFHADVLAGASAGAIELPVYLDDFETPSVWQQAVWPGNADGIPGNGDTWVLPVSAQNLTLIDLTPDAVSVVSRLCTMLALFGEDGAGNRFAIEPDSFRVLPPALGTMARSGRFCGAQAGTGSVVAYFGAFRDTTRVTVTPALTPSIASITLRDRSGAATNTLSPKDTMFVDVALSDGDGFRDVAGANLVLYHAGDSLTTGAPAFRAGFEWRRGVSPSFSLVDPVGTSWALIPSLCAVDTVTNTTGVQTVRFAIQVGAIARASSSGAWSAKIVALSSTPPDTTISLRTGLHARTHLAVSLADTSAAFAAGRAGAADLPLRLPTDGEIPVTVEANTAFDLQALATDLVGVSNPGIVLRVGSPTRRIAWAFDSENTSGGLLDTTMTTLPPTEPAPVVEGGISRELYLWIDHPASIAAQDYRGTLRVRAAASGDTTRSAQALASLTATVVSSGEAAQSATAEVLPHQVQVGVAAQSMTAYLNPTIQLGNTGIDRVMVHIPPGYGTPVVTSVRVGGFPASFSDLSAAGTAEVRLSAPVILASRIEIRFDVSTPTALDANGANFVLLYDDAGTSFPPQVAKEGDANGISDGDTWKVVVNPGPVASVTVAPDSATLYVGDTLGFTATATDAYGHPLTPSFTWTTTGGVGEVTGAGVFTAESMGSGRVIAATGGFADTARVTVRPTRGLQVLSVSGPPSVYQGQSGVPIHVEVANLGADSVRLDTLALVMTRLAPGDATSDFAASVDPSSPAWIAGLDTVTAALTLRVLGGATTGTVTIDARGVAVEGVSGVSVHDESADAPAVVTVLAGGITAGASQTPASVRPAERDRTIFQVTLQSHFPVPRTLGSLRLTNATSGPGDVDQKDAELGDVSLYVDDGDGTLEPGADTLLLSTVALGGSVTLAPLDRPLLPGGTVRLLVVTSPPLGVREGDVLDLALDDSTAVGFEEPVFFRSSWPLAPPGGLAVDGLVAGQVPVRPVPTGSFVAGSQDNVALEVTLPPNGYDADRLVRLGVAQLGTAEPGNDIERVRAWVDTGDRRFSPASDRLLGDLIFTGDRWQRTGLTETVPVESLRVFVTVDVAELARQDRTIRLGVPSGADGGIGMLSGNSGPLDRAIENPFPQNVSIADRVTWSAVPLGSITAAPGAEGLVLLQLGGTNSYASDRTLTDLTVTNVTAGPGAQALRDGEVEALTLRADGDGNGLLGDPTVDPVLGTSFFTGGRASFGGLSLVLPAGQTRNLFVVADLSSTEARDGDAIGAVLSGLADVGYLEPTTTIALWPIDSGRRVAVDGMVAAQIGTFPPSALTLGPGDGPVLAFDLLLPRNGYEGDVLQGVRVVNLGTAAPSDVAELRLWVDGGDGQFTGSGDDRDLGPLVAIGGSWQSPLLSEAMTATAGRFFVSATIASSASDSVTLRLAIPVLGVTYESGNDGPTDAAVPSGRTILVSTSPLLATLELSPGVSTVGQPVTARLILRNVGTEVVQGIVPSGLVASGTAALVQDAGPSPASVDLAPAQTDTIVWTYHAISDGEATLSCGAQGTGATSGLPRRAVASSSNVHRVYFAAVSLSAFPVQSMPVSVSRGRTSVVPLSLTFTNGGGPGASDIRVRSLRFRLVDGQGTGVVPANLLSRVRVNEGTSVYLDRTSLETSGADVDLTLATPVLVTGLEPVTLSLRVDVSSTTVVPSFRLVLADSASFLAEDANSGAPVVVHREGGAFPIQTGLAQIVAPATELRVTGAPPQTLRLARGASNAPVLGLSLTNPGVDAITSDVRLNSFAISFEDTLGAAISAPSSRVRRITVRSAIQTVTVRDLTPQDGSSVALTLSPPLAVPVNVPLDLTVAFDLADSAALGAFRLRLDPPGTVRAEDAVTRDSVLVSYAATPILGSTLIVEDAATSVVVRGEPRIPSTLQVGDANVLAMRITLRHPAGPGTARIRVDSLGVQVRNEARAPLVPAAYLEALRVHRGASVIANVPNPPASGSSIPVPLAPFWIEPGDSAALDVFLDVSVNAPASWLEIAVPGSGVGAADANSGASVTVVPAPGTELPSVSGLTRLSSPARDLIAGWEPLLPAVLVADGAEIVAARLRLANTAPAGAGSIRVDRLTLQASDRSGQGLALGAAMSSVRAYVGGTLWGASDSLGSDSTRATVNGGSALVLDAGETAVLELRMVARRAPGVDHLRVGIDEQGIGVVQPGGALLTVRVAPETGAVFPFWTEAGTFAPADLAGSYSNFPNPFAAGRGVTTFAYYLRADARVTLRLWTPSGDAVATVVHEEPRAMGLHQAETWDGRNGRGDVVRNGVYMAELLVSYSDGQSGRAVRRVAVVR